MAQKFKGTNFDFGGAQLQDMRLENASSAPTGREGRLYFNTSTNDIMGYLNSSWVNLTTLTASRVSDFDSAAVSAIASALADTGDIDFNESGGTITADINTGAVDADKIGANAVTAAKLNSDVAGSGLVLDGGTNAINLNLAASGGLEVDTDALQIKLDGSSLALGASGIKVSAIDGDNITISNLLVADFKAGEVVTSISDDDTVIPTAGAVYDAIQSSGHTQNTDTGTTSQTFAIDSDATAVLLKNSAGVLEVKNAGDTAYADFKAENVTINGNLTVIGTPTNVESENLNITDNVILLNKDESGAGVTAITSGIEIERGSLDNAQLIFDESDDKFYCGIVGSLTAISLEGHTHSASDITDFVAEAEDAAGDLLTDTDTIDFTYTTNTSITADVKDGSIVADKIGTDAVTAVKLNADCAGAGLVANGTSGAMDINVDDVTVEIATDVLQVKAIDADSVTVSNLEVDNLKSGVLETVITDNDSKLPSSGAVVDYVASQISANGYAANVGNNSDTEIAVNHGLSTLDVLVQVVEISTGETVLVDNKRNSTSQVTLTFGTAPTTDQYRVLIYKV